MPYMTLLAEGAADTGALSQEMITAMQTGFQSVATSVLAIVAISIPIGLTIFAIRMSIKKGIAVFKDSTGN